MIDYKSLRPGNWIHCKGSSHYGIVTGDLLALLEKEEKMREKFEYIELTGELLEAAGAELVVEFADLYRLGDFDFIKERGYWEWCVDDRGDNEGTKLRTIFHIHQVQNIYFDIMGSELPLPESAKLIPEKVNL